MPKRVEFQTADQIKIVADYYPAATLSDKGVVLVHMMPATRRSWQELAGKLQQQGYHALAIDLRGHGESGGGDYQAFSDEEHQASIQDLAAAAKFLAGNNVNNLVVIGASIGANLALQYFAEHPQVRGVVLLSPGLDYRGIKIEPLAAQLSEKQRVLLVGADDDAAGMGASCEDLGTQLGFVDKLCFQQGGHGTNLFQTHPELMEQIINFLNRSF